MTSWSKISNQCS